MSSKKTSKLNLHAWEGTDAFRRDEFNENFDLIDKNAEATWAEVMKKADADTVTTLESTLDNLQITVSNKADKSQITSLQTALEAVSKAANAVRIETGSYAGKGTYGPDNKNSIKLSITPKVLIIMDGLILSDANSNKLVLWFWGETTSSGSNVITYNGTEVTWYYNGNTPPAGVSSQHNVKGTTYYYIAIA